MATSNWSAPPHVAAILGAEWTDAEVCAVRDWLAEEHYHELLGKSLYTIVMVLSRSECADQAGDIVNEFLMDLRPWTDHYDPAIGPFRAFILKCLRNYTRDWLRKNAPKSFGGYDPAPIADDNAAFPEPFLQRAIDSCGQQLKPRERRAIELSALGYKPAEIARDLGVNEAYTRVILYNARRRMKNCLDSKGVPAGGKK